MALSRDEILKHAGDVDTKEVLVPKWGGTVILRAMTIREFEIHQARVERERVASDGEERGEAASRLLARVIVDDNGARLFRDDDVSALSNLGLAEIMKLTEALNELSGLGADAEKQTDINKKAVGESEAAPISS